MILDELAALLESWGVGTVGTDIFKGIMPDTPDVAVALLETGGDPPTRMLSPTDTALENPRIAIWARGAPDDYTGPRTKAQSAFEALDNVRNDPVGGTRYLDAAPLQQPFLVSRDENSRVIIGFNVAVTKVPS